LTAYAYAAPVAPIGDDAHRSTFRSGKGERMARHNRRHRQYIDALRTTSLFRECDRSELRLIASLVTPLTVPAGRVLTYQGRVGNECFVVLGGQAVVECDGSIVGHAVAGSVVGELALMDECRRTTTVTAATEMDVLVISRTEFRSLRALGVDSVEKRFSTVAAEHRASLRRVSTEREPAEMTAAPRV
jgi:CRP-like cAMP-binding protein